MAKIVITAIGSAGDVFPFLSVGQALARRGHHIVFCTHPPFAEQVEAKGFTFVPIGTEQAFREAMANPALWDPKTSFKVLWSLIFPMIRPHSETLLSLVDDDTVMVGSLWAFSARMVQELKGVPYISVQVSPSTLLSAYAPPTHKKLTIPPWLPLFVRKGLIRLIESAVVDKVIGPDLNALRASYGLAPVSKILGSWVNSPDGVLCLFPDWFAPPQPDWPANHFLSGFPVPEEHEVLDGALETFLEQGERPVVFTPGSTQVDEQAFARMVNDVVRQTGVRAIVLSRCDPLWFENNPAIVVRPFVPMRSLLPRCAAIVHHGGVGTASLAFIAGIPQVVTPFAHDQFDNAARVERSGCGVWLKSQVDARTLTEAVLQVLDDGGYTMCCARVREQILARPEACQAAAEYIERAIRAVVQEEKPSALAA